MWRSFRSRLTSWSELHTYVWSCLLIMNNKYLLFPFRTFKHVVCILHLLCKSRGFNLTLYLILYTSRIFVFYDLGNSSMFIYLYYTFLVNFSCVNSGVVSCTFDHIIYLSYLFILCISRNKFVYVSLYYTFILYFSYVN